MKYSAAWQANRFSASQEIPRILSNLKVQYCILTCPYPEPALSSPCPTSHFLKMHLTIILPSPPPSSKWSLSFRFPQQNHVYALPVPHMCHMPRPSHSSQFNHPNNNNIRWEQIIKLMRFSPLPFYPFTHSPKHNTIHSLANLVPLTKPQNFKSKKLELQQFTPLGSVSVHPCVTCKTYCLLATCFPHALSGVTHYHL